jgi:hypothetical protein
MKLPSIRLRATTSDDSLAVELRAIRSLLVETNRLLGDFVRSRTMSEAAAVTAASAEATELRPPTRSGKLGPSTRAQRGKRGRKRKNVSATLHGEIADVLRQAGEPLTAREIAERVVSRAVYRPPRSGHPVRGGQISARVNHPQYRSMFGRDGRRITLAE